MNVEGYAFFMKLLSDDENLWRTMASAAEKYVYYGDALRFAEAVALLLERVP
jgi:hypothetical protein